MPIDLTPADVSNSFFRHGDAVRLKVAWITDGAPERVEVRLVYRAAGKGTTDIVRVAGDTRPTPGADDQWDVTLTLPPDAPPTYDGRLLSISWLAQADAFGAKNRVLDTAELPLLVSPTGRPITPQRLTK